MQLYTPTTIDQFQKDLPYLIEIQQWVQNFLGKPHRDLGRSGPVCPFVPQSLKSDSIQFAVVRAKNLQAFQVEEIVLRHRDIFLEIEPRDKETVLSKAILLIFPELDIEEISELIDGVQQKLKPLFVDEGLMLGEFHKHNESPGLHNPNFRPLRSPIPLLAIRFMVESDIPFLINANDPALSIKYISAYLQRFGQDRDNKNINTARQALAMLQSSMPQSGIAQQQLQETNLVHSPVELKVRSGRCPFHH